MSISVACSTCGGKFKAPDSAAGRKAKCTKCGASFTVSAGGPNRQTVGQQSSLRANAAPPPEKIVAEVPPSQTATKYKECPFCGEQVLATAKKCKHCSETLDLLLRTAKQRKNGGVTTTVVVQQNSPVLVRGAPKSVAVAIILAFFFGPLGMLYSTVPGAVTMFLVNLVLGVLTVGFILIITWPIGVIWAAIAAANHNSRFG